MTRKDYIALARAISETRTELRDILGSAHVLNVLTERIAQELKADNGRFDRQKFYTAAGRHES